MKRIILMFLLSVTVFSQTSLSVWDPVPTDGQLQLYFSNPNVEVTRYMITWDKDGHNTGTVIFSDTTFAWIGGLDNGTYVFYVQARTSTGTNIDEQAVSEPVTIVNPEIPVAPYPTLSLTDDYKIFVKWVKSVGADNYKIEWSTDQYFFNGELYSKVVSSSQLSDTIQVENGIWYFRIYAMNGNGISEPIYSPPFILVDKPMKTELVIPWFTDNEWWSTRVYVKLPDNVNQAKLKITAKYPYPSNITLTNEIVVNGNIEDDGWVYTFTPKELFNNLIPNGSIIITSDTVGITASINISATNSEMVDMFNAINSRDLKTEYMFPGLLFCANGDENKGNTILAFAISSFSEEDHTLEMNFKFTDELNNVVETKLISFIIPAYATTAWIFNSEYLQIPEEYEKLFCSVTVKCDGKFAILASNQVSNSPTGLMFASWIEPIK